MNTAIAFSPSLRLSALTLAIGAMLSACGGGGGGTPATTASNGSPAVVESLPSGSGGSSPPVVVAQPIPPSLDAGAVISGWIHAAGTLLGSGGSPSWGVYTQNWVGPTPSSVSTSTDSNGRIFATQRFDFGCALSSIVLRTDACPNSSDVPNQRAVLELAAPLNPALDINANSGISLEVRNPDAGAQFALRVMDTSGQTIQYPLPVRFIEAQTPGNWARVYVALKNPTTYWGGANNGIPQSKISKISIVASALNGSSATLGLNYPSGQLEVRLVQLHANMALTYTLAPNNALATGTFLPTYTDRMAVANSSFDTALLTKAKQAGFGVSRTDIQWEWIETNGVFNFTRYTNGLNTLNSLGMKVLWILDYGHPAYGGGMTPPTTTTQIAGFTRFANEVAKISKDKAVFGYEIWNEPDQDAYWTNPDPTKYAALLNQTVDSIRAVDTVTPIISGGIAVDEPSYLYRLAKTGVLAKVNGVGAHPYRKDTIVTATTPSFQRNISTPETYAADQAIYKNVLSASSVTKPVYNTEWGYSTVFFLDSNVYGDGNSVAAANRQGVLVSRMVLTQLALNSPLITVFNLVDKGTDPADKEHHFGLLKPDGTTEKPAYVGLKTLYSFAGSRTFKGYLSDVPHGLHTLRWDGASDRVFGMWVDDPGKSVTVTLPAGTTQVKRWDGTVVTPVLTGGIKTVVLTEAAGPVYVSVQ